VAAVARQVVDTGSVAVCVLVGRYRRSRRRPV